MMGFQVAWGWPAALYLFLGGLGAGTFVAASAIVLARRPGRDAAVTAAYWLSTVCLACGLLALVCELGRPERGLLLWRSFSNASSWMTLGAWGLALALLVFLAAALLSTAPVSDAVAQRWGWPAWAGDALRRAVAAVGSALAVFVALYTGLLLKGASGVPFWGTWLLPALFVVSALAAGANAFALLSVLAGCADQEDGRVKRRIVLVSAMLTALEGALLLAYLSLMLSWDAGRSAAEASACAASAQALLSGECSLEFWVLVVATGLLASPALFAASCLLRGRAALAALTIGATCAVSGECALRFLVLAAGIRVDYVAAMLAAAL